MAYRVSINTEKYKDRRCSEKNWEPGTMNDFMHAINGWKVREDNLKELYWRIEYLAGNGGCFSRDHDAYEKWLGKHKTKNKITYLDKLCECERIDEVKAYGFAQGYFDIDKVIEEVRRNGVAKIPFSYFYDIRQYCKNLDGCFVLIEKV